MEKSLLPGPLFREGSRKGLLAKRGDFPYPPVLQTIQNTATREVLPGDGILLAFLGWGLMLDQLVLEVHPGFIVAYALALSLVGWTGFPGDKAHA